MQVIDQINGSALFAQSAYSASVATKDSLGRNITATYITGVDLSEYAKRTDVLSSIESATSGKLDVSSYASVSSDFLTNEDLNGYATVSQLESTSGDITALIPDTSNFITNSSAEATYQPIGNYLSSNALEGYATNESLDTASSFLSGAIDYVSANVGENIPVSNSGDLYKVEFDGVDLYGYKSTSSIPYNVYSAVSSTNEKSINNPTIYPHFDNEPFVGSLSNWSAFDIISISSNGEKIYPPGQPKPYEGVTALDVYYNASYLYDYNNNRLEDFSGYIGKITHDSLVVTSYFDKPSYFNNIARCSNFMLWFSADKDNGYPLGNNKYICSVGNKVESGTSKVEGIIVPGTVDLSPYQTTADANTLSSMLSGAIDYVSANAGKVYEGVSPIVVNNTEDKISADTWTFSAGSNVSFVDDNVNKITRIDCTVTGYNETVLYSNLTGRPTSPGQYIDLSESPLNFEYIEVYLNGSTPTGSNNIANGYEKIPCIQIETSNGLEFHKEFVGTVGGTTSTVHDMGCGYSGTSGTRWTKWYGYSYNVSNKNTDFNNNTHLNIWQVVGVNRKV